MCVTPNRVESTVVYLWFDGHSLWPKKTRSRTEVLISLGSFKILLPNDDLHPDSGGCLEWSPLQSFSGVVIAASSALVTCSHSIACRTRDATHPRYSVSCIVRLCPLIIVILSPVSLLAVVFMPDAELEEVKHLRCRNFARV